ncbi:histidine-specific methyltransferase [Aspergillus transmontanensis]|uniref:Histidine-specific methyltransferase n=1 Tax=Aspergillus transmontanensis TaxID=1034304 RepID=A0A5N6W3X2_9EURO|nr:histidine-specific methyltransferase [Aspergillus transmontanensis]
MDCHNHPQELSHLGVDVIDIRSSCGTATGKSLKEEILDSIRGGGDKHCVVEESGGLIEWSRSIPTGILYEGCGIDLYENITRDPSYYLYRDELSIFQEYSHEIAMLLLGTAATRKGTKRISSSRHAKNIHLSLVDLGAGRLDKSSCLLNDICRQIELDQTFMKGLRAISTTYCAVDLQYEQLQSRIEQLLREKPDLVNGRLEAQPHSGVSVRGVCGSYYDAMEFLRDGGLVDDSSRTPIYLHNTQFRKCLMWLGSSFTNLKPVQAAKFLRQFTQEGVLQTGDFMLIGIDRCRDVEKVTAAYSDTSERWQQYIQNGLYTAAHTVGDESLAEDWTYVARWDAEKGCHVRFVRSDRHRTVLPDIEISAGEHVLLAQSYKYTRQDALGVFDMSGLTVRYEWVNQPDDCSLFLLEKTGL